MQYCIAGAIFLRAFVGEKMFSTRYMNTVIQYKFLAKFSTLCTNNFFEKP